MSEQIGNMMPVVKVTLVESIEGRQTLAGGAVVVGFRLGATCVYSLENKDGWLGEIETHMTEGDEPTEIVVGLGEMDSSEFHNLPEFEGY